MAKLNKIAIIVLLVCLASVNAATAQVNCADSNWHLLNGQSGQCVSWDGRWYLGQDNQAHPIIATFTLRAQGKPASLLGSFYRTVSTTTAVSPGSPSFKAETTMTGGFPDGRGCSTSPPFLPGRTTLAEMNQVLGVRSVITTWPGAPAGLVRAPFELVLEPQPVQTIAVGRGMSRARWTCAGLITITNVGIGGVPQAGASWFYYDGEFDAGGVMLSWRVAQNKTTLESPEGWHRSP